MLPLLTAVPGGRLGFVCEEMSGSTITSTKMHLFFLPFPFKDEDRRAASSITSSVIDMRKMLLDPTHAIPTSTSPGRNIVMEMAALSSGGYHYSLPSLFPSHSPLGSQRNMLPLKLMCQDIIQRFMAPDSCYSPLLRLCLLGRVREGGGNWISLKTPQQKAEKRCFRHLIIRISRELLNMLELSLENLVYFKGVIHST